MTAVTGESWVLAFDAACARCREISAVVAQACDGKLEVLPLRHPDVQQWRTQALGTEPPWAPTLLAVHDQRVRAWTGPGMAFPLIRRLGIRSTARLLRALGGLPSTRTEPSSDQLLGRKGFLKLGAGLAAATGLILTGRTPATAAEEPECVRARAWVKANQHRLPETYADFAAYPTAYRQAIYAELQAETRSSLWIAHLDHSRAARPHLTAQQRMVLDQATRIAGDPRTFTSNRDAGTDKQLTKLADSAIAAFGRTEARAILATLGPAKPNVGTSGLPDCECAFFDDRFCGGHCRTGGCEVLDSGCGALWIYSCNGLCYQ